MRFEQKHDAGIRRNFLQKRQVIVRIWTSASNFHNPGESIGHVSIKTPNEYMSLWPKKSLLEDPAMKKREGAFFSQTPHSFHRYSADRFDEGREPEYLFCLYTLDPNAIEEKYAVFKKSITGWSVFGGLVFENMENCVSMAWELLVAGGITKLVSATEQSAVTGSASTGAASGGVDRLKDRSFYSSEMAVSLIIKSPDSVAELVKRAKLKELTQEKLTQDIVHENETMLQPPKDWSCNIL